MYNLHEAGFCAYNALHIDTITIICGFTTPFSRVPPSSYGNYTNGHFLDVRVCTFCTMWRKATNDSIQLRRCRLITETWPNPTQSGYPITVLYANSPDLVESDAKGPSTYRVINQFRRLGGIRTSYGIHLACCRLVPRTW